MKLLAGICCLLLAAAAVKAQDTAADAIQVFVVDSTQVDASVVRNITPDQIAMITVARGRKAVEKYGDSAANGVFYIETKPFAHKRYNRLFSSLSPGYAAALQQYGSDSSFRYIMGDSVLTRNVVSQLAALEPRDVTAVQVLTTAADKKQYGLKEQEIGVVVKTK
jgi:hypothetical protein